jgi:DNA-binding CsgD family transcriptional regulator
LTRAVQAVAGGTGTVLHVVGEAGIGKTSLLAAATDELVRHGVDVGTAAAHETDQRRHLALIRALLPEAELEHDADPTAAAIGVLEKRAVAGPAALVADDVHWADDASIEVLAAIARRVETLGVLLITAARPLPASHRLRGRNGSDVVLAPLAAGEVAALVEPRVGAPPGPRLTAWLADAAGNPFLALELAGGLAAEGRVTLADGVAELTDPTGLPGDLVERLARRTFLDVPGGELVLRAIAAVPGGLAPDELAALLDRPLGELVTVALAAVGAAVLVDTGTTLAFGHDLLRQAVLASTPPSIVRSLRSRAATVLLERQADPERVATCLLAASEPGDPAEHEQLLRVGRSLQRSHPAAAADLLHRALDGLALDDPRSVPATLELGWILLAAGRAGEVVALLRDRLGHQPGPVPVELLRLEGLALSLTGRLSEASARYDGMDPARLADQFDAADPAVVDAAAELALLRMTAGRLADAHRLVEWAEASTAPATAFRSATIDSVRAWLCGVEGAYEAGIRHARAALAAMARDDGLAVTSGSPTLALGLGLVGLGEGDAALTVFRHRATTTGAAAARPRTAAPLLQFGTTVALFRRGEWDDTLAEVDAGIVAAEETGLGLGAFWPYSIGALVTCARGDLAGARHWLDRADALSPPQELGVEWLVYASAAVHEAEGDVEEAASLLDVLTEGLLVVGAPGLLLNAAADTVRLALATGRHGTAARVVDELAAMTGRTASPVVSALAAWTSGLVAGDPGPIAAAGDRLAACGRGPEAAQARHDAAVTAARAGAPDEARRLATPAFVTYDALGAQHLHRRLRAELRQHGVVVRPRRTPPRAQSGWKSLTASETTVVDLAGEGLTNTQIAEQLYVSRRTVESHLGRIYTKLELSTRAQLVAATARRSRP